MSPDTSFPIGIWCAMEMATQPWPYVVARYEDHDSTWRSIRALGTLARQISDSPLATGLFAWTSMWALCLTQTPVRVPDVYPMLRISEVDSERLEFRYFDTMKQNDQWHRTVDAGEALPRLLKFLAQLHWFPPEVLRSVGSAYGIE